MIGWAFHFKQYPTGAAANAQAEVRGARLGESRPADPGPITAFLDSLPVERGSGIAPIGEKDREYKNWRGIPKPRRCPFCKRAKGEI